MSVKSRVPVGRGAFPAGKSERLLRRDRTLAVSGLAISVLGLQGTAEISSRLDDPTSADSMAWVALVTVGALGLLGRSAASLIAHSEDMWRRVFRCGPTFRCAALLSAIAVALAASLLARDPFSPLIASFRVTAVDIADAGFMVGIVICLMAAAVAFIDAWDLRREERRWPENMTTE